MTFALDRFKPASRTPSMQALTLLCFVVFGFGQTLYDFSLVFRQFIPLAGHSIAPSTSVAAGSILIRFSHNRSWLSSNVFPVIRGAVSCLGFAQKSPVLCRNRSFSLSHWERVRERACDLEESFIQ
jgi:hypothetical protein